MEKRERECRTCGATIVYRGSNLTSQIDYLALNGQCGACRPKREVR